MMKGGSRSVILKGFEKKVMVYFKVIPRSRLEGLNKKNQEFPLEHSVSRHIFEMGTFPNGPCKLEALLIEPSCSVRLRHLAGNIAYKIRIIKVVAIVSLTNSRRGDWVSFLMYPGSKSGYFRIWVSRPRWSSG
jgi:hypothetical protein